MDVKKIFIVGDHHGNWQSLLGLARKKSRKDKIILISVGDLGVGFPSCKTLNVFEETR